VFHVFFGVIALIFTGYIKVVTEKFYDTEKIMYLDFYIIFLGIIFYVEWLLVIKGSKRWQENGEKYIDYLEDEITEPLYKTIYYTKEKNYYSVSKINQILAWVVILTWLFLYNNCNIFRNLFQYICNSFKATISPFLPLLGTVFCLVFMLTKGQLSNGKYKACLKEGDHSACFVRNKKNFRTSGTRWWTSYERRKIESSNNANYFKEIL
jgi:hypothetical protein